MEEVLGEHNDDRAFHRFLSRWREIMDQRIEIASVTLGEIPGVVGLILAGSNGSGRPWPLSDIDLIPVYTDTRRVEAIEQVEQARRALLNAWSRQGWRTGLDVGRLQFTVYELATAFAGGDPAPGPLLADERWYHAIDKTFGGRALIDHDGRAEQLVAWFTAHRFDPAIVKLRQRWSITQACANREAVFASLALHDHVSAFSALLKSIQWYQISLMEGWGKRDNSLGRFGTRFERAAGANGAHDANDVLNELSALSRDLVSARLACAPRWVHERQDRSWAARQHIGESVTALQNDRDVLRVCTMYELRLIREPPYPEWIAIPAEDVLRRRAQTMELLIREA